MEGGMSAKISLIKTMNRRGARTEPWGTPRSQVEEGEDDVQCDTKEGREVMKEWIQRVREGGQWKW
jgi:hypothetical protein